MSDLKIDCKEELYQNFLENELNYIYDKLKDGHLYGHRINLCDLREVTVAAFYLGWNKGFSNIGAPTMMTAFQKEES